VKTSFWRKGVFALVLYACAAFLVLTAAAMFVYPGGQGNNLAARGYSLSENFFSDLGRVEALNGRPNLAANLLFVAALTLAGLGMALFFLAFEQFFRRDLLTRLPAWLGSGLGVVAAAAFIGVACAPADVHPGWHTRCVSIAFRIFPLAVFCYVLAMLRSKYPPGYTAAFAAFLPLLIAYVFVREFGSGLVLQVVSQKVIVYTSIVSVMIQAWGIRRI
jgi:hypothetical membrane protein